MNSYSYKIRQLVTQDIQGQPSVVVKILYTVSATDPTGLVTADLADSVTLPTDTIDADFIVLDQLSESTVITWLNAALTSSIIDQHRVKLDTEITGLLEIAALNTTLINQLPWDTVEDGADLVPNQPLALIFTAGMLPTTDTTPPDIYQIGPDGKLRVLESIVDPTVE